MNEKKWIIVASAIFVLLLSTASSAGDLKWGYVDVTKAMREVQLGKKAFAELQKMKESRQKELEKEEALLRAEGEELKNQHGVLSEDAFKRKNQEFARRQFLLQKKLETYELELLKAQDEKAKVILVDMQVIIGEIGTGRGYEVIFDKSGSKLLYSRVQHDLTNEVIALFDQRYGISSQSKKKKKKK